MSEGDAVTLLIDGDTIPVTHLFDEAGDDVARWTDAHSFVAGPLSDGNWLAALCADYQEKKLS